MTSGDEGTYRYLVNKGKKPLWRRVRKSSGESWQPDTSLLDFRDSGLLCTECHKRVKYKDFDCVYEMRSGDCFRIWFCGYCGQAAKEDNMTALSLHYERADRETLVVGEEVK